MASELIAKIIRAKTSTRQNINGQRHNSQTISAKTNMSQNINAQ